MARLRYNGLATTLDGTGLTAGATTITFTAPLTHSGGTAVPTISGSDYIPLAILDADSALSEIVYLTVYTTGSATGAISRGQDSTSAVAHDPGAVAINAPMVRDIERGMVAVTAKVKKSANQAVTANTVTPLTWETEVWDDANLFTSGSPTRFTIPAGYAGKYLVESHCTRSSVSSSFYASSILVNGVEVDTAWSNITISGGYTAVTTTILNLADGDYVQASVYSAVDCNVEVRSEFAITRLGS